MRRGSVKKKPTTQDCPVQKNTNRGGKTQLNRGQSLTQAQKDEKEGNNGLSYTFSLTIIILLKAFIKSLSQLLVKWKLITSLRQFVIVLQNQEPSLMRMSELSKLPLAK